MRKVTREVRLEKWAEALRERQASGMTITAWCEANGVNRQRYFYYQRKIREMTCTALAIGEEGSAVAEFAEYLPAAIEAAASVTTTQEVSRPAAVVHLACGRVEIYSGADRVTIENTLQALRGLC